MLTFPNAKINLGLNILGKRQDGYHDIETCLYPIPLYDALEIIPASKFEFHCTGLKVNGTASDNLSVKAYNLLNDEFDIPQVKIHLHKVIPMGGGLGGGSSDGAFTLKTLNDLFDLRIPVNQLKGLAGSLGSDCPFFIENVPVIASGRGTDTKPIQVNLRGKYLVLFFPDIHISTQEAYALTTPNHSAKSVRDILSQEVSTWKDQLKNDFEGPIFEKHSKLSDIKKQLYNKGAIYAAMTGSGSTMFGIFDQVTKLRGEQGWHIIELR